MYCNIFSRKQSNSVRDLNVSSNPEPVEQPESPGTVELHLETFAERENEWSRSKSFDLEFSDYESERLHSPKTPDSPSEHTSYPPPPSVPLYILSQTKKWRECSVVEVLENGMKWRIHYKGFKSKFDEIVESDSDRLTLERPDNVIPKRTKQKFHPYDRLWVQSANHKDIYREAVVTEVMVDKYRVHFISYHPKYDCEIDKRSSRLKS